MTILVLSSGDNIAEIKVPVSTMEVWLHILCSSDTYSKMLWMATRFCISKKSECDRTPPVICKWRQKNKNSHPTLRVDPLLEDTRLSVWKWKRSNM